MPLKADLLLSPSADLSYQMSSLFHGVIMEKLAEDEAGFVDELHLSKLHSYTQHLEKQDDGWHWILTFLNDDCVQIMWQDHLSKLNFFKLTKKNIDIEIKKKEITEFSYKSFNDLFNSDAEQHRFKIEFLTPTSFKSEGRYVHIPSLRLIYQSIMLKYDAALSSESILDEDILEELIKRSFISGYQLRSSFFSLEKVKIPSFLGNIVININGTKTLASFLKMLLSYGELCGVGIKTSIGMGAIRVSCM